MAHKQINPDNEKLVHLLRGIAIVKAWSRYKRINTKHTLCGILTGLDTQVSWKLKTGAKIATKGALHAFGGIATDKTA